jgi:hypothetical protein
MLTNKFVSEEKKYLDISDHIFNNYDTLVLNEKFKNYIDNSTSLINKYKKIWPELEYKRIISNIISLNLFILNNYIYE